MGRPSDFTAELADAICSRLENGESLKDICDSDAMPHKRTVLRWVKNREDFAEEYHLARWAAAEVFDDEARQLIAGIKDRDTAIAARAKFEILRWRAGVHAPRVFGDRLDVDVGVKVDIGSLLDRRRQRVIEANAALGLPGPEDEQ